MHSRVFWNVGDDSRFVWNVGKCARGMVNHNPFPLFVQATKLGRYIYGYLTTPMAQGRSTKFISLEKRIRTSRLSIKKSLAAEDGAPWDSSGMWESVQETC